MRILLLRRQPCARARVHAVALRATHPEVELGLARQGALGGEDLVREWRLGEHPARVLREIISDFAPDAIHSYDAELTIGAVELTAGRIPVIHDVTRSSQNEDERAIEESAALVAESQELLEKLAKRLSVPSLTCVFPSYSLARELPPDERHHGAEANIDLLVLLYQRLAREPMVGLTEFGTGS